MNTRTGSPDRARHPHPRTQHTRGRSNAAKKALFITCTEASLAPTALTRRSPEVLFEVRNLGNIVPKNKTNIISSDIAAIQYALHDPHLRDIIVCGHSGCAAVAFLLDRRSASIPQAVKRWLFTADSRVACESAAGAGGPGELSRSQIDRAARAHLAVQAANLLEYANVAKRRATSELRLHTWFYNEKGRVESLPAQDYLGSNA